MIASNEIAIKYNAAAGDGHAEVLDEQNVEQKRKEEYPLGVVSGLRELLSCGLQWKKKTAEIQVKAGGLFRCCPTVGHPRGRYRLYGKVLLKKSN